MTELGKYKTEEERIADRDRMEAQGMSVTWWESAWVDVKQLANVDLEFMNRNAGSHSQAILLQSELLHRASRGRKDKPMTPQEHSKAWMLASQKMLEAAERLDDKQIQNVCRTLAMAMCQVAVGYSMVEAKKL